MNNTELDKMIAGLKAKKPKELLAAGLTPAMIEEQVKELEKYKWENDKMEEMERRFPDEKKIIQIKVPKNDEYTEFAYAWIKYPDRIDVSIAMTMKDTDPLKGKQIVLENSWLDGDKTILTDTELFLSACTILDQAIGIRQAIVKKNWMNGQ